MFIKSVNLTRKYVRVHETNVDVINIDPYPSRLRSHRLCIKSDILWEVVPCSLVGVY
jgi:hypothetical protein